MIANRVPDFVRGGGGRRERRQDRGARLKVPGPARRAPFDWAWDAAAARSAGLFVIPSFFH